MERTLGRRLIGLVLGLTAAALSAEACQSFDTYCEELADCEDGNDADIDACIIRQETEADRASLYGCTEWFDLFVECAESNAKCRNDRYGLVDDDCEDEQREYSSCMGDSLPPAPF